VKYLANSIFLQFNDEINVKKEKKKTLKDDDGFKGGYY
jgi:hypothetical protein